MQISSAVNLRGVNYLKAYFEKLCTCLCTKMFIKAGKKLVHK